ncbi:MAG: glycosyltransferase family 4 protein [Cyanobacteria bacterium J06632_19]
MVKNKSIPVTLAHINPAPFVQQVGRALSEAEMLSCFATTVADQPQALWRNSLCNVAKLLNYNLAPQLSRRAVTEFPLSLVMTYPWREIIINLLSRVDKDKRFTDILFHWGVTGFDKWVASQALDEVKAVYGYESGSLRTFEAARKQGIARIYDVPSPEHDFVENLLHKEEGHFPELITPYRKYVKSLQERRTRHRRREWELADVVIANSEFTKASYANAGLDVTKVRVIPYGAPPVCENGVTGGTKEHEPVNFLWAGTFSVRKGAHYLLQAWKDLKPGDKAKLSVFGAMGLAPSSLQNLPDSIKFSGTVPRSQLYNHYYQADVLVFPTLCDGFGMVVTEAFAQGLPVITTDKAGAADLVRHGVNGLIIPAGDIDALTEAMNWCMKNRQKLRAMRQAALETAASWQWSDYRRTLVEKLLDGLKTAGYQV